MDKLATKIQLGFCILLLEKPLRKTFIPVKQKSMVVLMIQK